MEELINKFDQSNLYSVIEKLPEQLLQAWDFTSTKFSSTPDKIFISGMGGSALPANILKTFLANSDLQFNIPIHINRTYTLPKNFDAKSGGIFISYSGNTEETLSALGQAIKTGFTNLIVLATGGKIEKLALDNHIPFVKIPNDVIEPRMGYGYFVGSLLKILTLSDLLQFNLPELKPEIDSLLSDTPKFKHQAQTLAKSLRDKTPIIYTSDHWKYLAMVIKINFNENSKIPCFWNVFPELNHNEMVGYTNPLTNYKILIFQDPDDNEKINQRIKVFQKLMENKLEVEIIPMSGQSAFSKLFSSLLIGLWTSYYLALEYGVDPAPVEMVEQFKALLNQ
ncbi:bifunctional phosphoglucose/phosphomannose isomerase [Candidatus Falkowbacteria bacterium RIFOXYA2_FULL_35_8]|uniref:Bifunctional phosphoglucose/phosphomannose isomerase n=1 Tax=Candidatus Falkowbacteria bacterium RIFOXYC2_FULL_36_12 TaxID=1798002 RepID=A0A1F5T3C8_9BACT|nr:MAG: bifunctional phosphoglucose/phosphomannose isomerase [Candidatus Falkowbacteria bacterium RIFOXYC2_FULL_36_12]OGF34113.1 MAG: bifunctional phosphoglucose/phosphomannose isomerase [Candidatus Falkowbacteria bacterium RIFOXYA2_FULL_35_8]